MKKQEKRELVWLLSHLIVEVAALAAVCIGCWLDVCITIENVLSLGSLVVGAVNFATLFMPTVFGVYKNDGRSSDEGEK